MKIIENQININKKKRYKIMKKMKLTSSICLRICGAAILAMTFNTASNAAVTIGYVANTGTGYFVTSAVNPITLVSTGTLVNTGEVSVGFFKNPLTNAFFNPSSSDWSTIKAGNVSNAWSALLALGYTDVRSVSGATLGTGFDPSFSTGGTPTTNIGMTTQNIPFASLPASTRMYVLGFNAGAWDNTSKTATFGTATEFGVVSAFGHATAAQNFLSPADGGTKSIQFKTAILTNEDVLIGNLVSSANGTVAMIPEPSSASLLALGVAGLVALRIRRKS
jgi:hypothetical protein